MLDRIALRAADMRDPVAAMAGAVLLVLAADMSAWAQQQPQPQPQPPTVAQTEPPKAEPPKTELPRTEPQNSNPGLLEEVGKLFKDPTAGFKSLPTPAETFDGLSSGTKDAADSLKRLTPSLGGQSVSGRVRCGEAANGAPDCKTAADQLCKGKGFGGGNSVDIESAHKCSAKSFLMGKKACGTEYFVTRAVCQ